MLTSRWAYKRVGERVRGVHAAEFQESLLEQVDSERRHASTQQRAEEEEVEVEVEVALRTVDEAVMTECWRYFSTEIRAQ